MTRQIPTLHPDSRLTILEFSHRDQSGRSYWFCQCECGSRRSYRGSALKRNTKSCGCLKNEKISDLSKTHGRSKDLIYQVWNSMISRCYRPSQDSFRLYGGRGISVCDRWRYGEGGQSGFECFILDMGDRPSRRYSIERKCSNKNYEPSNCEWALSAQQNRNRRNAIMLEIEGRTKPLAEWCEIYGISYKTALRRRNLGWEPKDIVGKPLRRRSISQASPSTRQAPQANI